MKVTEITPEMERQIEGFVRKWADTGLSTAPAHRSQAEDAIRRLYALANLKEPTIIWFPCPMSAALGTVAYVKARKRNQGMKIAKRIFKGVYYTTTKSLKDSLERRHLTKITTAIVTPLRERLGNIHDELVLAIQSQVNQNSENCVDARLAGHGYFKGSLFPDLAAVSDYFHSILHIPIHRSFLVTVETCGFFWPLDSVCFASEKPERISVDKNGKLHSDVGHSIRYPSGWGLFHFHGVPKESQGLNGTYLPAS